VYRNFTCAMRRLRYLCYGANSLGQMVANPKTYTYACTYVSWQDFLSDDRLGKHVVKYSGAPLEARSSSGATLDSSLDRSFPSLNNFCDDFCADGNSHNDNDHGDGSLDLCKRTYGLAVRLVILLEIFSHVRFD